MTSACRPIRRRKQKRTVFVNKEDPTSSQIRLENHRCPVLSCEFDQTGEYLLSSNSRGEIHICDVESGDEKLAFLKGHQQSVTEVHYSRDGANVFSGCADGTVGIWDTHRGYQTNSIVAHGGSVNTVQYSRSGWPMICSGSSDKTVRVWDIRQRRCAAKFENEHAVLAACFSECGTYVFSAGLATDGINVWDVRYHERVNKISGHTAAITGLSVSPCGKMLASCSADNTLRKYNINIPSWTGKDILSIPLEQDSSHYLLRCAWSPDASILSAGTSGQEVLLFDARNGERLWSRQVHEGLTTDIAFHPLKRMFASAATDKFIFLQKL